MIVDKQTANNRQNPGDWGGVLELSVMDQLKNRRTLSDLVAAELRERIVSGRLPMGAELNQLALTEELGVNRAAVREAFRQLEASGIIQLTPHHHAVVTTLSEAALGDLMEVRRSIEGPAARQAAQRIAADPDGTADGRSQIERLTGEMERQAGGEAWLDLDRRFHLTIAELSANPIFLTLLDTVRVPVDRFMRTRAAVEPRIESARAEHRAILDALLRGDGREAERQMVRHVQATKRFLKERLHRMRGVAGEAGETGDGGGAGRAAR